MTANTVVDIFLRLPHPPRHTTSLSVSKQVIMVVAHIKNTLIHPFLYSALFAVTDDRSKVLQAALRTCTMYTPACLSSYTWNVIKFKRLQKASQAKKNGISQRVGWRGAGSCFCVLRSSQLDDDDDSRTQRNPNGMGPSWKMFPYILSYDGGDEKKSSIILPFSPLHILPFTVLLCTKWNIMLCTYTHGMERSSSPALLCRILCVFLLPLFLLTNAL